MEFVVVDDLAFFAANDGVSGIELWATDGTTAGTYQVLDIHPGSGNSSPGELVAFNSELYFRAYQPGTGNELWKSDGTAAGTVLVADIFPSGINSGLGELQTAGGMLYMTASGSSAAGEQVWASDGTTAGTYQVSNSTNGPLNPYRDLTSTDAGVFFLHDDGSGNGFELWFSDGTPGTELMLKDIRPGAATGPREGTLVPALGSTQLLFAAADYDHGLQLWLSDGTPANTRQITNFGGSGYGAVLLDDFTPIGARVFFAADGGTDGLEPWVYDAATGGIAYVLPYGLGCSSVGTSPPTLSTNSLPTLGNSTFEVTMASSLPLALALPAASLAANSIPLPNGCRLLIDLPVTVQPPVFTDALGDASSALPLPNSVSFVGASVYYQWAVLEPGVGPFLDDFALSHGLQIQVGQ